MPPVFGRNFQSALLCAPASPSSCVYGAITLYGALFQGTSTSNGRVDPGPTSPCGHPARIRLALYPFRSPLLRVSRLISFPLPTKMLQFGRLPFPQREWACAQEVSFGHPRFIGSLRLPGVISRLGTTFIGSRTERSPIWFVATRLKSRLVRLTSAFCLVQAAYAMPMLAHWPPSSAAGTTALGGRNEPCVYQGRLGVPAAHLVRWAADDC